MLSFKPPIFRTDILSSQYRSQTHHAPTSPEATNPRRLLRLSSRPHSRVGCRASASTPLARGQKPPGSTQAGQHRGLRLSQPKVSILRHYRCSDPCSRRGWQACRAERIQTFRCQACRTTFTSRRNTPLYRLKTPSQQVAVVLSALSEGLDPSAAERVFD
jgi:hypothetical protein